MGKTNLIIQTMKALFIIALFIAYIHAAQNPVDQCLKELKVDVDRMSKAAEFGLQSNWLDMAKLGFETMADGIQTYENCQKVNSENLLNWVSDHASQHQMSCLLYAAAVFADVQQAVNDMRNGAAHDKVISDWVQ